MMPTRRPLFESTFLPILLIAVFGLTGCYTQIAALEPLNGGLTRVEADYEDDGDVVVRKFYEDGTVDQDYYPEGYDWYTHEPFTYRRYFSSFYDPGYGVDYYGGCGYFNYCDPYYGNHFSMSLGFGYGGWGYSRFGFGYSSFGYSPWGWGGSYYNPWGYASYPSYAYYPPYYGGYYGGNVGTVTGSRGTYGPRGSTMTRDALAGSGSRSGSGDLRGGRGNTTTVGGSRSTLSGMSDRQVVSVGSSGSTLGKDADRRTTRSTLSNGRTTESTRARTYGRTSTTRSRATSTTGSTRTRSYGTSGSTRSRTSEGAARSTRTRSSDSGRSAAPPRARTDSGASRSSGAARSSGSSGASRSSGATRSSSNGGSRSSSSGTTSKRSGRNNN